MGEKVYFMEKCKSAVFGSAIFSKFLEKRKIMNKIDSRAQFKIAHFL